MLSLVAHSQTFNINLEFLSDPRVDISVALHYHCGVIQLKPVFIAPFHRIFLLYLSNTLRFIYFVAKPPLSVHSSYGETHTCHLLMQLREILVVYWFDAINLATDANAAEKSLNQDCDLNTKSRATPLYALITWRQLQHTSGMHLHKLYHINAYEQQK